MVVQKRPTIFVFSNMSLAEERLEQLTTEELLPPPLPVTIPSPLIVLSKLSKMFDKGLRKGLELRRLKESFVQVDDWLQLPGCPIYVDPEKDIAWSFHKRFIFFVQGQGREAYEALHRKDAPVEIFRFPDLKTMQLSMLLDLP